MVHSITRLVRVAAELSHVSCKELLSSARTPRVARARFAVVLVARELGFGFGNIGQRLGGRHHTTAMHGLRRARELLAADDLDFAKLVNALLCAPHSKTLANNL